MKKIFKILTLTVIVLMLCAALASCGSGDSVGMTGVNGSEDESNPLETSGSGNTTITETTNNNADAEITELSIGYLTEEAYNKGNFDEQAISKTVDFTDREAQYMVVDLKIKTLINNSGDRSVKITSQTSATPILCMMVQDAPTGKFEAFGDREGYHLIYSILTKNGEEKPVRMILKLIPNKNGGNVDVSISISGADETAVSGKTGASQTFHIPSNLIYTLENDAYIVTGLGDTDNTEITIPAMYKGKPVTSIGIGAFYDCSSLTSIVIPDSVTIIGDSAFGGCSSLTSMTIPDGVTIIGHGAFGGCSSLTSIAIPDSVTIIDGSAFYKCNRLTSVTIGNGLKSIRYSAFEECSSLTNINIPDGVTSIDSWAFEGCSSLTNINIPDGVTSIGSSAFSGCSSLTSMTIPDSVTYIGESVFSGCKNLTSITLPFIGDTLNGTEHTHFGYIFGAPYFESQSSYIPTSLKSVTITKGMTSIGSSAFSGCSNLTSIVIPDSVTRIGGGAFQGCSRLSSITLPFIGSALENEINYTYFGYIFGAKYFESQSFYIPTSLKSVTITKGVTSIDKNAFYGCNKLTSIVIPDSVTSIGTSAFSYCSGLTSIVFGGTKEQWEAINFGFVNGTNQFNWNYNTGNYTITCTDGTLSK